MMPPSSSTAPSVLEEQQGTTDSLPIFVTRTTLRSIFQARGVGGLLELERKSDGSKIGTLATLGTAEAITGEPDDSK